MLLLTLFFGLLFTSHNTAYNARKPLLQEMFVPKNLFQNQTIHLLCALAEGESVIFEWFLNDQKLTSSSRRKIKLTDDSSELIIRSLSVDDLGEVKCTTRNEHGADSQKVRIMINIKPTWLEEPHDMTSSLYKEISLKCEVRGYPTPTIQWSKLDETRLNVLKKFGKSSTLTLNITKENSGFYKCIGENGIGLVEKTIRLAYFGEYDAIGKQVIDVTPFTNKIA